MYTSKIIGNDLIRMEKLSTLNPGITFLSTISTLGLMPSFKLALYWAYPAKVLLPFKHLSLETNLRNNYLKALK